ncbi:MAG TPA: hypothetical protein VJ417_10425, partial [Candidatus Glassbacteria bacterium]|nr:hypothetical protein [Candidatus Glassbacteria bacterium]
MHKLLNLTLVSLFCLSPLKAQVEVRPLEDFEDPGSLNAWQFEAVQAELITAGATSGRQAARLVFSERSGDGPRPGATLRISQRLLPGNEWLGYDRLVFDIFNPGDKVIDLRAGLYDSTARMANAAYTVAAGSRMSCELPVSRIYRKVEASRVERSERRQRARDQILNFTLGTSRCELILDNVRLVADSLKIVSAGLGLDPFGGGRVSVEAETNHGARLDLRITDPAGRPVARRSEESHVFLWSWEDPSELATLAPGTYRAGLTVTDFRWQPDSPVTRDLGDFEVLPETQRPELVAWYRRATQKVMLTSRPAKGEPLIILSPRSSGAAGTEPLKFEM